MTRHFYQPPRPRTLQKIRTEIPALVKETNGLLDEIVKGGEK